MARPSLFTNLKFRRLAMRLGNPGVALGHLAMIWYAAYESGDPRIGTPRDVECLAFWDGEAGELVSALLEAGFLDQLEDGQLQVHGLTNYAPEDVTN